MSFWEKNLGRTHMGNSSVPYGINWDVSAMVGLSGGSKTTLFICMAAWKGQIKTLSSAGSLSFHLL